MRNKIPAVRKAKRLNVSQLHRKIVRSGGDISYQALHRLAGDNAMAEIPDNTNLGSIMMIARALGVSFDDLVEYELA